MGLFAKLFKKKSKQSAEFQKAEAQPKKVERTEKITNTKKIENTEKNKTAPLGKKSATNQENSTVKKPTSNKSLPQKSESDDELADKIANDESTQNIKINGLNGFFEIKKSKDNRFVFNLYASNRVIIATSQIYSSSQSAENGANSVIANAEKAHIEDQTSKDFSVLPYPKWEIYKDRANQYRFRLSASNGSCICHSQGYTTKASCKNGIESIIKTVKSAKIDKIYLSKK